MREEHKTDELLSSWIIFSVDCKFTIFTCNLRTFEGFLTVGMGGLEAFGVSGFVPLDSVRLLGNSWTSNTCGQFPQQLQRMKSALLPAETINYPLKSELC